MKLSVSNIAWPAALDDDALDLLAGLGVAGVELAPTRIAPWESLDFHHVEAYRKRLETYGLVVSSLQAILFERPTLKLLGDEATFAALRAHTRRVAEIAKAAGARVMVFGAPRNRLRQQLSPNAATQIAIDRLQHLADDAATFDATIGLEPVPSAYGGDFLLSWSEVLQVVSAVHHPGLRVHLDTACVALAGDSIAAAVAASAHALAHFHAAQPELKGFGEPIAEHALAAVALREAGYDRWLAIEMREQQARPLAVVAEAVSTVRSIYL